MKKKYLEAGKIVNTHGILGEVKILPWADDAAFLLNFSVFYINEKPVKLLSGRVHKGMLIARLEGVSDISSASALKNRVVCIDRGEYKLPEGDFFIQDIIGAKVFDESGAEIGTLEDVFESPASNIYVVRGEREILIPAVPEFILETDIEGGKIIVHMMEGL